MITNEKNSLVKIRDVEAGDHNFIMSTVLRGLYYGDSWFSLIPKNVFMSSYHPVIERMLKAATSIKVACLADQPDVVLGYAVYRDISLQGQSVNILDYVYVKSAWRRVGIAKALVPIKVNAVTHLTRTGKSLLPKLNAIFNPFCLS